MDRSSVAIVIPAFNEEGTISAVVEGATRYGVPIVVDDASQDRTGAAAQAGGAIVVHHRENQGYDGALNSGFAAAAERDFLYIVTLDADGQHDSTLIPRFLSLLQDSADIVIGIRPSRARLGERVFCLVTWVLRGVRDPLCGMKGYRMALYRDRGHFDCYGSIGTELALFAARRRHKYRIAQVEVPIAERRHGVPRFAQSLRANWKILRAMVRGLLA